MKGIYIHIPFCVQKCNYCDFASYAGSEGLFDAYTNALINEMTQHKGERVDTIYIGGGTPTCLDNENLRKILWHINQNFEICSGAEFTIEANPKTIDSEKARMMRSFGVNRISLGCQSFDDAELKMLGRIHTVDDIYSTYDVLTNEGFENINLDIMYALPRQNSANLSTTLDRVINIAPKHISCYGLKYEEGTPFYEMLKNGKIEETDDDTFADMYNEICRVMNQNGYEHYEISNFAKHGYESRHNLKYWTGEEYLGFGVAASSFVFPRRYTHSRDIGDYINGYKLAEDYTMTDDEAMREFVILALRVIKTGVDKQIFKNKFNVDFDDVFKEQISKFSPYLINTSKMLKIKENACLVSNSILCEFM